MKPQIAKWRAIIWVMLGLMSASIIATLAVGTFTKSTSWESLGFLMACLSLAGVFAATAKKATYE